MILLDGKAVAKAEKERIKQEVARLGYPVHLTVVLVGENFASKSYVASKEKACLETGIGSDIIRMPETTTEEELLKVLDALNKDPKVNGILVQLPLPKHIKEENILEAIDPYKDADCFHPSNVGKLLSGNSFVEPCTPKGIMIILEHYKINPSGMNAVVLGRSNIVGKPIAALLMHKNATVTICHSKTKDLPEIIGRADIVVAAIGKADYVKGEWIKEGAVVIDVGINRVPDATKEKGYRVVGDVEFDAAARKASYITPVPGGVGLLTVSTLLDNTVQLARVQKARHK